MADKKTAPESAPIEDTITEPYANEDVAVPVSGIVKGYDPETGAFAL